jgi:hypothetical protein
MMSPHDAHVMGELRCESPLRASLGVTNWASGGAKYHDVARHRLIGLGGPIWLRTKWLSAAPRPATSPRAAGGSASR